MKLDLKVFGFCSIPKGMLLWVGSWHVKVQETVVKSLLLTWYNYKSRYPRINTLVLWKGGRMNKQKLVAVVASGALPLYCSSLLVSQGYLFWWQMPVSVVVALLILTLPFAVVLCLE